MPPPTECKCETILAGQRDEAASATPQKQKIKSYHSQKWPSDRKFSVMRSAGAQTLRPSRLLQKNAIGRGKQ